VLETVSLCTMNGDGGDGSDRGDRPMSTSERRSEALQMQMATRQMFQSFKERIARIKDQPAPQLEKDLRRGLWWESALAGTVGCVATFALLRRRVGVVASALGGTLVGNGCAGMCVAVRHPPTRVEETLPGTSCAACRASSRR